MYSSISVRVKNPDQVQSVEDAIKKMGFTTFSILDASRGLQQVFQSAVCVSGIFGSLALIVASIGIVNTLVMAILERRREIGIMKAIGASDGDVKKLFFAEAGAMGILGGVVGVALGWAIGQVINFGTNVYLKTPVLSARTFLGRAVVAGRACHCFLVSRQPGFRLVSGGTRRQARSRSGAALRINLIPHDAAPSRSVCIVFLLRCRLGERSEPHRLQRSE